MSVAYDLAGFPDVSPFEVHPSGRPAARPGRPGAALARPLAPVTYLVPPSDPIPWRLTRRGVRVAVLAVLALSAVLVAVAWRDAPSTPASPAVPTGTVITVGATDSLWSIATRVAPDRDPRAEVLALQQVNRLSGAVVHPGEQLIVP